MDLGRYVVTTTTYDDRVLVGPDGSLSAGRMTYSNPTVWLDVAGIDRLIAVLTHVRDEMKAGAK